MRFRTALLGLGTGLVVVLSACGNGPPPESNSASGSGGGSSSAEQIVPSGTAAKTVNQTDALKFDPTATSVKAGDIVEFDNVSNAPHNVRFDDGTKSDDLSNGGKVLFKFAAAGSYHFVCTIHPGMEGTVTVG